MDVKPYSLLSLYNHSKQVSDQDNLASHIPFLHSLHFSFSNHIHDLKSLQGLPRRLEGEKTHPRFRQAFDEPVILFDQVVEVFHLPQFHVLRQRSSSFELSNGFGIRCVLVHIDHARR
jgi:hypothetical protein